MKVRAGSGGRRIWRSTGFSRLGSGLGRSSRRDTIWLHLFWLVLFTSSARLQQPPHGRGSPGGGGLPFAWRHPPIMFHSNGDGDLQGSGSLNETGSPRRNRRRLALARPSNQKVGLFLRGGPVGDRLLFKGVFPPSGPSSLLPLPSLSASNSLSPCRYPRSAGRSRLPWLVRRNILP